MVNAAGAVLRTKKHVRGLYSRARAQLRRLLWRGWSTSSPSSSTTPLLPSVISGPGSSGRCSTAWLYVLSIGNFGLSFAWSLSFALTTPFFERVLNAGPFISHIIWALGPISGMAVAPIVGSVSDRCTSRLGRRRPFILGGAIVAAIAMLMFPSSLRIAEWILRRVTGENLVIAALGGSQNSDAMLMAGSSRHSEALRLLGVLIGTLAFALSDFAINASMWPMRALQGDLVVKEQQHEMQGASLAVGSFGDLCAQVMVSMIPHPVANAALAYSIGATVITVTTLITFLVAQETPLSPTAKNAAQHKSADLSSVTMDASDSGVLPSSQAGGLSRLARTKTASSPSIARTDGASRMNHDIAPGRSNLPGVDAGDAASDDCTKGSPLGSSRRSVQMLPDWARRIAVCNALSFFCLFCVLPNASSWVGSSVLGGSPSAPDGSTSAHLYESGVQLYGRAGRGRALVQIVGAAVYPLIANRVKLGNLFGGCFLVFGVVSLLASGTHNRVTAGLVVISMSIPMLAVFSVPPAETVARSDPSSRGKLLGLLNVAACVPQLLDTMYTGLISRHYGEEWVIRVGAIWAILTGIVAPLVWPA